MMRTAMSALLVVCGCTADVELGGHGGAGVSADGGGSGDGGGPGNDGGGAATTPKTCSDLLREAQACLTYEDWVASGIQQLATAQDDNGAECQTCHASGMGGFLIGADDMAGFLFYQSGPVGAMQRLVTCTIDDTGNAAGLVPSSSIQRKGTPSCLPGDPCHTSYELSPAVEAALDMLVHGLLAKTRAGGC